MTTEILKNFETILQGGKETIVDMTEGKRLIIGEITDGFDQSRIALQVSPDNETWYDLVSLENFPGKNLFILELTALTDPTLTKIENYQILASRRYRLDTGKGIDGANIAVAADIDEADYLIELLTKRGISTPSNLKVVTGKTKLPDNIEPHSLEIMASYFLNVLEKADLERINGLNLVTLFWQIN